MHYIFVILSSHDLETTLKQKEGMTKTTKKIICVTLPYLRHKRDKKLKRYFKNSKNA